MRVQIRFGKVNIFDIHLKKQRCSEIGIFDRKRRVKHGLDWSRFCHWTVFNHLSLRLGHHYKLSEGRLGRMMSLPLFKLTARLQIINKRRRS